MTTNVQAATAALVKAPEASAAPARAEWIKPLNTWTYEAASSVFNAPNNIENSVAYTAAKAVCAVASAFVAIASTIAYLAMSVVNGAIHTLNAGHNYFNSAEEAPVATQSVEKEKPAAVANIAINVASVDGEEKLIEIPPARGYLKMATDFVTHNGGSATVAALKYSKDAVSNFVATHGGSKAVAVLKSGKDSAVGFVKNHNVAVPTATAAVVGAKAGTFLAPTTTFAGYTGLATNGTFVTVAGATPIYTATWVATVASGVIGAAVVGGAAYLASNYMNASKA